MATMNLYDPLPHQILNIGDLKDRTTVVCDEILSSSSHDSAPVSPSPSDHGDELQQHIDDYIANLRSNLPAEFLCDNPRSGSLPRMANHQEFMVEAPLYAMVHRFCINNNLSELVVLLSAFRVAHYRMTGATDATIGVATRHMESIKPVTITLDECSFQQVVAQTHQLLATHDGEQHIPFSELVSSIEKLQKSCSRPLLPTLFSLHLSADETVEASESESEASLTSVFDIEFHLFQQNNGLRGKIVFAADLFHLESVQSITSVFQKVLASGIEQPEISVSELPLFTENDYSVLDAMSLMQIEYTKYPRESSIATVFREQASLYPNKVAVKDSASQLTYFELDLSSDAISLWLSKQAFTPETIIGVLAGRSCETISAFLGILKANLAYLPLDIRAPATRIETIMASIPSPRLVLLGDDVSPPAIDLEDVKFVTFADIVHQSAQIGHDVMSQFVSVPPSPSSLAYVKFTSGSTGRPKGVMVEHRNVLRLVKDSNVTQQHNTAGVMAHISNLAFDASTYEIYSAILNGGTLVCLNAMEVLDPKTLESIFLREAVEAMFITPALLKQYLLACPTAISILKLMQIGGDRVDIDDAREAQKLMRGGRVMNGYGPTENTIYSTMYCPSETEAFPNGMPIGRAVSNSGAYVMDSRSHLVPLGVIGELVVTGDGLSRGYTDSKLNFNRFVTIEILGKQIPAYRTGDYVRYRPTDGQLEFFGRIDGQVKIRGNRVELGEIEHAIRNHKYVSDAVILVQKDTYLEPQIVGFASLMESTQRDHMSIDQLKNEVQTQLQESLMASLPPYMVPKSVIILDEFPINANGKVDRKALEHMIEIPNDIAVRQVRQPTTDTQRKIRKIWASVLKLDENSIDLGDSFFNLGGHSMDAMKVVGLARQVGLDVTVAQIFRLKTLENIANEQSRDTNHVVQPEELDLVDSTTKIALLEEIDSLNIGVRSELVADIHPSSRVQDEFIYNTATYLIYFDYFCIDLDPKIDLSGIEENCNWTLQRYPILRSHFMRLNGKLWQVELKRLDRPFSIIDIHEDLDEHCKAFCQNDVDAVSETETPIVIRLLRHPIQGNRLLVRLHHAQYDAMSLGPIIQSLVEGKKQESLPKVPTYTQYMSYTSHKRNQAIEYWRELLRDSSLTTVLPKLCPAGNPQDHAPKTIVAAADVDMPTLSDKSILMSTVIGAAWAILIARIAGVDDLVYIHVVTGRNSTIPEVERIIGPCMNYVPVRIKFGTLKSPLEVLQCIQEQLIAMGESDSLSYDEIVQHCTDWPARSLDTFDSVIQHQTFGQDIPVKCSGIEHRLRILENPAFIQSFMWMASYPQGSKLHMDFYATTHLMTQERANSITQNLAMIVDGLANNLESQLQIFMDSIDVRLVE